MRERLNIYNFKMTRWAFTVILIFAVLTGCAEDSSVAAALGEVPDTVSENVSQVTISSTGRIQVDARRLEYYSSKELTLFYDVSMKETDINGEITLEGQAERVEMTGDQDGIAEGSIRIRSRENRLNAEYLDWDSQNRLLTGTGPVRVESGDGITITGEGFVVDAARETYTYTKGAEGTLETSDPLPAEVTETPEDPAPEAAGEI